MALSSGYVLERPLAHGGAGGLARDRPAKRIYLGLLWGP